MFYNKNKLILSLSYCLLFVSSNCKQVPILSISDHKDILQNHRLAGKPPVVSLSSYRELGSISCMGGAKTDFLFQCKGTISNINLPLKGQLAFIGIVDGARSPNKASPIVKSAIDAKDKVEILLWQGEDGFIYWHKPDTGINEWIIKIKEQDYKKLTSKTYAVHMVYLPNGASPEDHIISTNSVQINAKDKNEQLPNYQNIGLEAIDPIEEQINNSTGWFLKGKINADLKNGTKMGFILVREAINPYPLVQQVMASKEGWPTLPTSFNDEMVIIPGSLREKDPPIVGELLSSQAPIQGGKFKVICYWIQNQHCYLSQMEHIISDGRSKSDASAPATILFTDDSHRIEVSNVSLCREEVSEGKQVVTLSDFKIDYALNGQKTSLPAHLKPFLLFLPKNTLWRTATIESLFKKLKTSNQKAGISDDGTICLAAGSGKLLDASCINFFSRATDYEYFVCLLSTENHKLTFCTQKENITIQEKEKPQLPKKDGLQSHRPIDITLDNKDAHITLTVPPAWKLWSEPYIDYNLPKVTLTPKQLDKNKLAHGGFLIAKAAQLNGSKMDNHSDVIRNFIKNKNRPIFYDGTFLIFQEELTGGMEQDLVRNMYDAYKNESAGNQALKISYWAEYENKIVWSSPVSIELIIN
ncbi:hypothetical protein [Cardinium endosymbiont of Bemisia tabaci]|uniref:hypothetical protein n=1 Tax=Cardinium endosymbiont of Bemisia tabaci TaxID=672794 RepID=UPI000442D363|nr:hypothetical protein [Cardinium endosymbiont of Bemisia tabaci]CDG49613.1 Hypothetical protein CHV_a0295 [Cardinium endosymbiont cBtQ1 of Bemisia tabaci]